MLFGWKLAEWQVVCIDNLLQSHTMRLTCRECCLLLGLLAARSSASSAEGWAQMNRVAQGRLRSWSG